MISASNNWAKRVPLNKHARKIQGTRHVASEFRACTLRPLFYRLPRYVCELIWNHISNTSESCREERRDIKFAEETTTLMVRKQANVSLRYWFVKSRVKSARSSPNGNRSEPFPFFVGGKMVKLGWGNSSCYHSYERFWHKNKANRSFSIVLIH